MKLSIFFITFSLLLSCGSNSAESEAGDSVVEGSEGGAGESQDLEDGGLALIDGDTVEDPSTNQKPVDSAKVARTGPCAKYPLSCGSDNDLCAQKYLHCLLPTAGDPTATEELVCRKEGEEITLVVNTWSAPAGKNKLLCDFWENTAEESALWAFATNQIGACKNERDRKKTEWTKAGYKCE